MDYIDYIETLNNLFRAQFKTFLLGSDFSLDYGNFRSVYYGIKGKILNGKSNLVGFGVCILSHPSR